MKRLLILISCLLLGMCIFTGCMEDAPVLPDTPDAIEDIRDDAMADIQTFVTNNEATLPDRLTTLISYSYGDQTQTTSEYVAIQQILSTFAAENQAERLFIIVKNEDGNYQKTVSSEESSTWLEDYSLPARIAEEVEAGLISSAKSGHDNLWPVYAPMYNSAGEISAVAVLEVPCDLTEYPEWDRDSESWHGIQ